MLVFVATTRARLEFAAAIVCCRAAALEFVASVYLLFYFYFCQVNLDFAHYTVGGQAKAMKRQRQKE